MASSAELLLDTSAALAYVDREHVFHASVDATLAGASLGLAGHARFETYSVLTRQAPPKRLSPHEAVRLIESSFAATVYLSAAGAEDLAAALARSGIAGGAVYDALVAAAAREAGRPLVTCDERALRTYDAVGVEVLLVR